MQFKKFPKTDVVAQVAGDRLVFRTNFDVDSLHDFGFDALVDDLCLSLTGTCSLKQMTVDIVGTMSSRGEEREVLLEVKGEFDVSGCDPDHQPTEISAEEAINHFAELFNWSPLQSQHALGALNTEYGNEVTLKLPLGRALHTPAHPATCSYFRIVDFGFELGHWVNDEGCIPTDGVMGALIGLAQS